MEKKIPYSGGPKRLAFQFRKLRTYGSTASLLIKNRFGVWSVVRHRLVKKTRYLRFLKLKADAGKLEKGYVLLRKLGVNDEKITFLRRSLADFYWNAAPARYRADVLDYFRQVRRDRRVLHFVVYPLIAALLVATSLLLARILVSGYPPVWFTFGFVPLSIAVLCKTGVDAWRNMADYADNVVVRLLDQLACL
jgi:hypothetical protein